MPRWSLLLLLAVAACGGDPECPLIGCVSQLTVEVPADAAAVRACVAELCSSELVDGRVLVPLGRRAEGSSVDVTIEITDAAGGVSQVSGDAAVQRNRPNGEGCPPVCVVGRVGVDDGDLVDLPPDGAGSPS